MISRRKHSPRFASVGVTVLVFTGVLLHGSVVRGQVSYEVLHSFAGGADGASPYAGLIQVNDGNLCGTTANGGTSGQGTVFQMTTDGIVNVLHAFGGSGVGDGAWPYGPVIQAADGNFYGTTFTGGAVDPCGSIFPGCGTVFQMTPDGTVTVINSFPPSFGGAHPDSGVIQATDGNLYGTTEFYAGTVFKMATNGTVGFVHVLMTGAEGGAPFGSLVQASDGNLYGTTLVNGPFNHGTLFRITPDGTLTVLHAFAGGADGDGPRAALIQADDGNLYGTTVIGGGSGCGGSGCGTVFRVAPDGTGYTTLHAFSGGSGDGAKPVASLIQATDGKFYGTTEEGGASGRGTVFTMTPEGAVTILYAFAGGADGARPDGALLQAADARIYGTTVIGGDFGRGVVFRVTLP